MMTALTVLLWMFVLFSGATLTAMVIAFVKIVREGPKK